MGGRLDPAVAAVRGAVREACADIGPGEVVVVACSGGADSMALVSATVFEGRHAGWLVRAAVVDHGLQPGSDDVARVVAERLRSMGVPDVDVLPVDVGTTGGPEGAARSARYGALEELSSRESAVVLLGHTRSDQAESVLLGLARGSGTRSLAGMPSRRDPFRRPLLGLAASTTVQACAAEGIEIWSDPHNDDHRFARVRVRRVVLPMLERELGPGVVDALARTADQARDDADALDAYAADLASVALGIDGDVDLASLVGAPEAVRRRVLRLAALAAGCPAGDLTAHHVAEIERLVDRWHGQARVDLPGRASVARVTTPDGPRLRFTR